MAFSASLCATNRATGTPLARSLGRSAARRTSSRTALPVHHAPKPRARTYVPHFRVPGITRQAGRAVHVAAAAGSGDSLLRTISDMGELSVMMVDGTRLVNEAVSRHKCAPAAAVALGRGLISALLMGVFKKDGEATQITFRGNGALGQLMIIATNDGMVKGMMGNPGANATLDDGSVDVPSVVGPGTLTVVRSHPSWKEPYSGMVPITTGEIAEDLAQYMVDSEQQRCALAAGVAMNPDGTVAAAAGFLIQALPLISDETVELLERNISQLPSLTDMLKEGKSCADITNLLLKDIGASPGAEETVPRYGPCEVNDLKERMKRAIATLGEDESKSILEEQGHVEITCDFCNETMRFNEEDVLATIDEVKANE